MNKDLSELIDSREDPNANHLVNFWIDKYTLLVVSKNNNNNTYNINRYFSLGNQWVVSYDMINVSEEEAWRFLPKIHSI